MGTVDRVLHNRGRVSSENVKKILQIVDKIGYRPNVFASKLSGGQLTHIAVVMPDLSQDSGYWSLCWEGMERAARELEPFQFVLDYAFFDRNSDVSCLAALKSLEQTQPQAWLVAPIHEHLFGSWASQIAESTPLLFFDTDFVSPRSKCFIGQDAFQGGYVAGRLAELLLSEDSTPGMVVFDDDDFHLSQRCEGFSKRCSEKHWEPAVLHQSLGASAQKREEELKKFLKTHPTVKVLFVPNVQVNHYACVAPHLKLIGFDLVPENVRLLKAGAIDFLISQRPEEMGYESVRRLYRRLLLGETLPEQVIMPIDVLLKENVDLHS